MNSVTLSRRSLMRAGALGASIAAVPAWARGGDLMTVSGSIRAGFDEVSGDTIALTIGEGVRSVQGRRSHAIAVNGSVPGRWSGSRKARRSGLP